jgi:hypothetical protein
MPLVVAMRMVLLPMPRGRATGPIRSTNCG